MGHQKRTAGLYEGLLMPVGMRSLLMAASAAPTFLPGCYPYCCRSKVKTATGYIIYVYTCGEIACRRGEFSRNTVG